MTKHHTHNDELDREEPHAHESDDSCDDVTFEDESDSDMKRGATADATAKIAKLKAELAEVKEQRQEYLDGWQRCKADTVNARKEALASAERSAQRALENFIEELLPAIDGFDMAAASESWGTVDEVWRTGIGHIHNQLLEVLGSHGVTRFGKVGEHFSPHLHEAVQEVDGVAGEPGSIVRVLRSGYRMGERIIRPAQVIVKAHGLHEADV